MSYSCSSSYSYSHEAKEIVDSATGERPGRRSETAEYDDEHEDEYEDEYEDKDVSLFLPLINYPHTRVMSIADGKRSISQIGRLYLTR